MIDFNSIYKTDYRQPIFYGHQEKDSRYQKVLKNANASIKKKKEYDGKIITEIENCSFFYEKPKEYYKGALNYRVLSGKNLDYIFQNQSKNISEEDPIKISEELDLITNTNILKVKGNAAVVPSWHTDHYSHNFTETIPKFEFLRQKFSNEIKFIIPIKDCSNLNDISPTLQQLRLVNDFYKNEKNIELLEPNRICSVNGTLNIPRIRDHFQTDSDIYGKYAYKCLSERLRSPKAKEEKIPNIEINIIFCPREHETAKHGRCQTNEEIEKILKIINQSISKSQKKINLSIFRNKEVNSFVDQRIFFKNANIIIGVHGTQLINMIWSDSIASEDRSKPLHIIEFLRNGNLPKANEKDQAGNDLGYWRQVGPHYNVQFHHAFFESLPGGYSHVQENHLEEAIENCLAKV